MAGEAAAHPAQAAEADVRLKMKHEDGSCASKNEAQEPSLCITLAQ